MSDKPDGDNSFDIFARDLAAFLNLLDLERPLLVGHSWGAMLALDYAARFPAGPRSPAGLVLVDGALNQLDDFPGATWESVSERLAPPRLAGMPLDAFLDRLHSPNPRWQPDEQAEQIILANFEIAEDDTISPRLTFERHMQIVRAMWEFPTYARFAQVRCPVLALPAQPAPPLSSNGAGIPGAQAARRREGAGCQPCRAPALDGERHPRYPPPAAPGARRSRPSTLSVLFPVDRSLDQHRLLEKDKNHRRATEFTEKRNLDINSVFSAPLR